MNLFEAENYYLIRILQLDLVENWLFSKIPHKLARMAELVDAPDLGSGRGTCGVQSPLFASILIIFSHYQ